MVTGKVEEDWPAPCMITKQIQKCKNATSILSKSLIFLKRNIIKLAQNRSIKLQWLNFIA